jgi:rhodanese-related sulfurtransferase
VKLGWIWRLPIGEAPEISPQQLKEWLDEGKPMQLIDARSELEYQQGTLLSARLAPVTNLPAAIDRINLDPSIPVIVLCLSGHRSLPGTRLLRSRGFEAYSLRGGLIAWKKHNGYHCLSQDPGSGSG